MSLKRCCCVSAMKNVRHREIDDVEVWMRSRRRRTCEVKDHTSSKRSLDVVGRPYCQLARRPLLACAGYSFLRERAGVCVLSDLCGKAGQARRVTKTMDADLLNAES